MLSRQQAPGTDVGVNFFVHRHVSVMFFPPFLAFFLIAFGNAYEKSTSDGEPEYTRCLPWFFVSL